MSQSVVGVRFKPVGKIYQFDPGEIQLELHDAVIVETAKGREYGEVAYAIRELEDEDIHGSLKPILRRATPEDKRVYEELKRTEKEAHDIFISCARKRNLQMKLIDVEYTFDKKKIVFYFTAEGRVDFRDLVKDLASEFRVRIELRQIGVRDEAKNFNGVGICGRPCCCSEWIGEFFPVTIKMAKEQNLSLNSSKISGICGRLLCCLTYEQEYYEEISKKMPKVGYKFKTPEGPAEVFKLKTLEECVLAKIKNDKDEVEIHTFTLDQLEEFKQHEDEYPDEPVHKSLSGLQTSTEENSTENHKNAQSKRSSRSRHGRGSSSNRKESARGKDGGHRENAHKDSTHKDNAHRDNARSDEKNCASQGKKNSPKKENQAENRKGENKNERQGASGRKDGGNSGNKEGGSRRDNAPKKESSGNRRSRNRGPRRRKKQQSSS